MLIYLKIFLNKFLILRTFIKQYKLKPSPYINRLKYLGQLIENIYKNVLTHIHQRLPQLLLNTEKYMHSVTDYTDLHVTSDLVLQSMCAGFQSSYFKWHFYSSLERYLIFYRVTDLKNCCLRL